MNRIFTRLFLLAISGSIASCMGEGELVRMKYFPDYSSASAVEVVKDKIYMMGDDASYAMILNTAFDSIGRIEISSFTDKRIDRSVKHDIESSTIIKDSILLWMGSGSKVTRNTGWMLNIKTGDTIKKNLDAFYALLQSSGIKDLNIEGFTYTPQTIVLANRGNKSYPKNELIFLGHNFLDTTISHTVQIVKAGFQPKGAKGFTGISGLTYSKKFDRLFATVSTESAKSKVEDGEIGKSYLWIFDDISAKRRFTAINPSRIIDLSEIDRRFTGHKIESISILNETEKEVRFVLVSDNDNGTSTIFEFRTGNKPLAREGSTIWDL